MIEFKLASLQLGTQVILNQANLRINPGAKVGLIGQNGAGKSSLFRVILGELSLDAGTLSLNPHWHTAHMAQEIHSPEQRVMSYVMAGDLPLYEMREEIFALQADQQADATRLVELQAKFADMGGHRLETRAAQILNGLGFSSSQMQTTLADLSGGWQVRANLARALMTDSDLLLLDEPTNHLDLDAILWVEGFLRRYTGTLLLISHDREFLDAVVEQIVELDQAKLCTFAGNYSRYETTKAERILQQQAGYEKQQRQMQKMQSFVDRFRAKASKAKQAQSRLKQMEKMQLEAPAHWQSPYHFQFASRPSPQHSLVRLDEAVLGYPDRAILQGVNMNIEAGSRITLLGPNGAGKSTLIKTLAGRQRPLAGELFCSEQLQVGYFAQHQLELLEPQLSPFDLIQGLSPEVREQEIKNFLGGFGFRAERIEQPVEHFSGGEKARLVLASILWQKPNLLLLDEPTNHLDLSMRYALLEALNQYEGAILLVSHDRFLLNSLTDDYFLVADGQVKAFAGGLEEYHQWLIQRRRGDQSEQQETPGTGPSVVGKNADKKKNRQLSAQLRQRLQPLKKAISRLEQQIEQLQGELQSLQVQLAEPEFYEQATPETIQGLTRQQHSLTEQIEVLELDWLDKQTELEECQKSAGLD